MALHPPEVLFLHETCPIQASTPYSQEFSNPVPENDSSPKSCVSKLVSWKLSLMETAAKLAQTASLRWGKLQKHFAKCKYKCIVCVLYK